VRRPTPTHLLRATAKMPPVFSDGNRGLTVRPACLHSRP
jgi:hypothetical protein